MKEVSIRELELMARKKGWRIDPESQKTINIGKITIVLNRLLSFIVKTTSIIQKLEKRDDDELMIIKNLVDKISTEKYVISKQDRIKEWVFTVVRDSNNNIVRVVAKGK